MSNYVATVRVQSIQSLPDVLTEATALVEPGTKFGFSRADGYRTITMPRSIALSMAEKFNDLVVVSPPPAPLVGDIGSDVADKSGISIRTNRTKPRTPQSRSPNKGENDG